MKWRNFQSLLEPLDCWRYFHPVSTKLSMLYHRTLGNSAVYIPALVIQQNNSQSDAGCCCESLQKCLEGCQKCHKYSAQLFQTKVCEVKLRTVSFPGLALICTGWHSVYWPSCFSKVQDQKGRWWQGWTFGQFLSLRPWKNISHSCSGAQVWINQWMNETSCLLK